MTDIAILDHPLDGYLIALGAVMAGWRRPPKMSVAEWADKNRIMTSSETSQPGPWRTSSVPFMREIMESLSPHNPCQRVVFIKSTQVAGTESGLNWVGAVIDLYPGPMLFVEPTIEVAELWSKQRLANMIAASPTLSKKVGPNRSRDSGNTTLLKEFPGGLLRITGANSGAGLRSMPVRYLCLDEVDAYPDDCDGEGDPIRLAEERTNNFPRRKIFLISTPTVKGASKIDAEWEASDQRRYHLPCPHCGHEQPLRWGNLKWNTEVSKAWYVCEENGCIIEEHFKTKMLAAGRWIPTYPDRAVRGYHINSLYSPIGLGRTWKERAQQWKDAQGLPLKLKSFINTCLGEAWEDRSSELDHKTLKARAEPYKLRTIPVGCLLLTAGVDTQDDRLAIQILGHGRNGVIWVIDWLEIYGNPAGDELWSDLDAYLDKPMLNQFGISMRIEAVAVDTGGHHAHMVYQYCRERQYKRYLAIKGSSLPNRPIMGKPTKQDVNHKGQVITEGVQLWSVGTDTAKTHLTGLLCLDGENKDGLVYKVRFSDELEEDYYKQLTNEVFDPTKNRWRKRTGNARNEALDTLVYAYAAALHPDLRVNVAREADWKKLEYVLEPQMGDLFSPPLVPMPDDPAPESQDVAPTNSPADAGLSHGHSQDGEQDDWLSGRSDNWLE